MSLDTALENYAREALKQATYEPLGDGSWVGRAPALPGVICFDDTRPACEAELLSVVEDWARWRLQRGLQVPVVGAADLNSGT